MATRRSGQGGGAPYASGLNLSDTSTSGTKWWIVHHQTVYAMYERQNFYNRSVSSNTLVTPIVAYNMLEFNIKVNTTTELVYVDFSAGSFNQYQDLVLTNNGVSGGFGSSGTLTTSGIGIMRRPATLVAGEPIETGGSCSKLFNYSCDQTPGPYSMDVYDTSADVQPKIFALLKEAKDRCPSFETFLVNI